MSRAGLVVATDRGGHLHNALSLLRQMGCRPDSLVTTYGPDIDALSSHPSLRGTRVCAVPYLFSWAGKRRWFNPFKALAHVVAAGLVALRLRPRAVVSVGATNVVLFCYWARLFGADVYHVECMNQVDSASVTGRLLYPICRELFVQWPELKGRFGPKATYAGWVLGDGASLLAKESAA